MAAFFCTCCRRRLFKKSSFGFASSQSSGFHLLALLRLSILSLTLFLISNRDFSIVVSTFMNWLVADDAADFVSTSYIRRAFRVPQLIITQDYLDGCMGSPTIVWIEGCLLYSFEFKNVALFTLRNSLMNCLLYAFKISALIWACSFFEIS